MTTDAWQLNFWQPLFKIENPSKSGGTKQNIVLVIPEPDIECAGKKKGIVR